MKIVIRPYINPNYGNCTTEDLEISSNQITVSKLKTLLLHKYHIEPSQQRLTVKIAHMLVTMTDEWPLSFYYITHGSIIYLEFIQIITKTEELRNKIQKRNAQSKYMMQLGFSSSSSSSISKRLNPSNQLMTIINESPNEYNEDLLKQLSSGDNSKEYLNEMIISAVKSNSFSLLKELFEQRNDYEINMLGKSGWNALHYAAYYGYGDIVAELTIKRKCNANVFNKEGWTALHLAAFKGHGNVIAILVALDGIKIDIDAGDLGTPLHCACRKNHFKIVSILLYKANVNVYDSQGRRPEDLTTDANVKKLLLKVINKRNGNGNGNGNGDIKSVISRTSSSLSGKSNFTNAFNANAGGGLNANGNGNDGLSTMAFIPPKPPKAFGSLEKSHRFLPLFRFRYIEVDSSNGTFKRFKSINDFPQSPNQVISLSDIHYCKKKDLGITKDNEYHFDLCYGTNNYNDLYRLHNLAACNKWIDIINSASIYYKFLSNLTPKNRRNAEYLGRNKSEAIFIDSETGEIKSDSDPLPKARKRRVNPYSNFNNGNESGDMSLVEDSTLTMGICYESFKILELLGSGTFGKVFRVELKTNGSIYAMKAINKKFLIKNQQLRYAITECNVLKQTNNPFIVKLHYSFQTQDYLYMVLDYCEGGDLGFILRSTLFEEEDAQFYIAELILALEHLHNLNIIYRDLKPDNILIDSDSHIKLADFGLAKENIGNNSTTKSFCGSAAYLSPEMVTRRGVGKAADIYGIGAVLYEMICGTTPFYANDINTLYNNISNSELMLHDYFSEEMKDLLKKLMDRDPNARIGVKNYEKLKLHPWFDGIDWEGLEKKEVDPPINLIELREESTVGGRSTGKKMKKVDFNDCDYNEETKDVRRVKEFTFVRPHSPDDNERKF